MNQDWAEHGEAPSSASTTSSSYYPPAATTASYYRNPCPAPAPEPSPPPSLLSRTTTGDQSSFTSSWLTPATAEDLAAAAAGDDEDYDDDTNFVFENGRRYHAPASGRVTYPLPNDESEQERDDMKHKLALWMMHEKLFYAPVEETLKHGGMVFDLGMIVFLLSSFFFFMSAWKEGGWTLPPFFRFPLLLFLYSLTAFLPTPWSCCCRYLHVARSSRGRHSRHVVFRDLA